MIDWLENCYFPEFPPTEIAQSSPNGLLAAGGEVSPIWLDQAYRQGIFPWNSPNEQRLWWSPSPRAVILPENFRIPRTIKKLLKKEHLVTCNLAFSDVMRACSAPRKGESGTWISEAMIQHYSRLFDASRAISVEYWTETGELAGGFYGLIIGSAIFGESMFSRVDNASKIAFAKAAPALFAMGVELIDCQMHTAHLAQFGLVELERPDFEQRLKPATNRPIKIELPTFI